jgi:D-3-phosphoglycerate dehydrogenase
LSDKVKILVTGQMTENGLMLLKKYDKFKIQYTPDLKGKELLSAIKDIQGLIIRTETAVTRDLLKYAPELKVICRSGIGVDHIDFKACEEKNIIVMNTPEGNRWSVVEMTIGVMIGLSRMIPQATLHLKSGKWDRSDFTGTELKGKTLGIIGLGNIGSDVAKMAEAFSMSVVAYDPYKKDPRLRPLDEVLKVSDFISFHTPLTSETRGMANAEFFKKMKKSSFFINTSRGQVCVEEDLLKVLESGHIRGAALDVFSEEPLSNSSPLLKSSSVILTPHTAGQTREAQDNMSKASAIQIRDFFEKGKVVNRCQV